MRGDIYSVGAESADAPPRRDVAAAYPRRKRQPAPVEESSESSIDVFSPLRDRVVPIGLIATGLTAGTAYALVFGPLHHGRALELGLLALEATISVGIALMGMYLASLLMDLHFGDPIAVGLKIAGMTFFALSAGLWAAHVAGKDVTGASGTIGIRIAGLVYFICFYSLFDMDLLEALMTTVIVALCQGLMMVGLHAAG